MAFALVGGYLGHAMAKDGTFQHLRVFEDVVSLVVNNYVEEVNVKEAMQGALKGLAEGLDADSAYLTPDLVACGPATSSAASTASPPATCLPTRAAGCCRGRRAARSSCWCSAATPPSRTMSC
jgi:hypothetical protein